MTDEPGTPAEDVFLRVISEADNSATAYALARHLAGATRDEPKEASRFMEMLDRLAVVVASPRATDLRPCLNRITRMDQATLDLAPLPGEHVMSLWLQRRVDMMELLRHSLTGPDGGRDAVSAAVELIVQLVPKTPEQVAEVEEAVVEASADPEKRGLAQKLADRLAQPEIQKMTPWAVFVLASADFVKLTENANPNVLSALAIIVMVWIFLMQGTTSS